MDEAAEAEAGCGTGTVQGGQADLRGGKGDLTGLQKKRQHGLENPIAKHTHTKEQFFLPSRKNTKHTRQKDANKQKNLKNRVAPPRVCTGLHFNNHGGRGRLCNTPKNNTAGPLSKGKLFGGRNNFDFWKISAI